MAADNQTDLLPLLGDDVPHFDIAMRGYDRRQVEEYVSRAEGEIAEIQAARDAALATSADRAAQLASNAAHIESLKRQVAKTATDPVSPANVSDRIRDMLQLATDEATQTRRAAEEEADRVLSAAKADAERVRGEAAAAQQRLTAGATQRSAEADQKLANARTQAVTELENAKAEIATLVEAAQSERTRLDREAAAARQAADDAAAERRRVADEDFEITLRSRRRAAETQAIADHEKAKVIAQSLVEDAQREVIRLASEREAILLSLAELHAKLATLLAATKNT
jgi:cell division septum initiation protein DivIVA